MAVNPYDQYFAELEEEERRRLRGTLDGALATQPDRFAAQKRVARYLGYPTSVVEVLPNLEQQAKIQSIDEQTEGAPAARRAYTDADFARLAHDDSGNLTTFERTLRGLSSVGDYLTSMGTEGRTGLLPDISASVWRANAGLLGLARGAAETAAPLLDPLTGRVIPENPLRSMAGAFGRQARRNEEIATGIAPAPEGVIGGGVSSGVQSLFQNILTLPVTLANPTAGLTVMSSIEGGRSYQEARERGIAPIQALPFAASQGLIEYATEKIPVGRLLGDLNRNTGLMRTLVNQMAAEVPGEQVATLLQDLNSWAVLNPEKPFSAYLAERPSAAAQTFIATLVGTGGTTLVAKGMDRLAVSAQQRAERAALAEDNAIRLEQLDQLASASKVRQRDAESFESFVASAAAEGPVTHVYIDAKTLAQSTNVEAIAAVSPSVAAQLPQAAASGGVVAIPIEEYAANIAGTELNQGLIDNLRTEPEGFSRTEAKEFMQSQAEELRAEVEQVIARQENQDAYRASIDTLRNQITGELNQLGRFKGDVNQAYATLMSNWFGVLGGKLGMAPADLYTAYRPTFQAEGVAGSGVLDQAVEREAPARELDRDGIPVITMEEMRAVENIPTVEKIAEAVATLGEEEFQRRVEARMRSLGATTPEQQAMVTESVAINAVAASRADAIRSGYTERVFNQSPGALPLWSLERAKGARITGAIKKSAIALSPKAALARRNYEKLDAVFKKVPDPLASEEAWRKFMSLLVADRDVLGVPHVALKYARDPQAVADYLKAMRPDQLASRRAGFALGSKIRAEYAAGNATPITTGRLLLWGILSRSAGAYPHEAAYMDLVNAGVDQWIEKAARGEWTETDGDAYEKWSQEFMATRKSGVSPAAQVTSNANDFGRILLTKLSQKDEDGVTGLTRLHNLMADQNVPTDQVRREFFALGDGIGIQNKVLSFTLLVTGRWDTLVLDRVQFTHLWGDSYRQLAEAAGVKPDRRGLVNIYDPPSGGLAPAGEGHFGVAVYEALARGMSESVRKGYELAGMTGEGDGTLGAFHWDSWLVESSQAIGHPTIEALTTERPRPDLAVKQGKFDTFSYNFEYRADGQYQIPMLDGSGYRLLTPAEASAFSARIANAKEGVVPKNFKVSDNKDSPWVDAPGVNRERYDQILAEFGRPAASGDVAPAGVADAAGDLPQRSPDEGVFKQSAYHGTPHRGIKRFSTDFMGTGEGAQAYGWGLYFASLKDVARKYSPRDPKAEEKMLAAYQKAERVGDYNAMEVWERAMLHDDPADILAYYRNPENGADADMLRTAEKIAKELKAILAKGKGQLYEVEIPEDSEMLDWDKPLSEQPEAVQNAMREVAEREGDPANLQRYFNPNNPNGGPLGVDFYHGLSEALGSDKAASEYLASLGIKGIRYLDGDSRASGEGSHNYVIFSGDDVAIRDQFYQGRGNRGSFNPSTRTITLLKAADLSTFLHESAHFFLEVQLDVAAKLGGKAELTDGERQVLADTETLLKWFGVQDLPTWYNLDFEEQREYHERFARGFEAYLFEGRPPAIELQGLFQRFRAWLLNVYRSLKALNVELSDDVRGVFDRMLASSDEIALAEQGRSMMAMFETPEQAGMTVEEFAAYQALGTQATADAMDELQGRTLRDMQYLRNARGRELKRLQRQADELRREIRAQVRTEVMSEPVYRAWTFLTNELTVDDMTAEQWAQDAARRAASAWRAARKGAEAQARVDAENAVWEASPEYQVRHKTQSTRDKARRKVLRRDAASVNDDVAKALAAWDQEHPDPQREQAPRSNPNVVDETRDSLLAAIAKLGGINRAAAEAEWGVDRGRIDSGVFGKPVLRREGGLSIDGMAEALAQYGYLPTDENGKVDLNDLAERFDAASRGEAVFSQWVDAAAVLEFDRAAGRDIPNPTALSAGRLDRDALREIGIDDVIVRRLQDHKMVASAGLHPDVVAEIVGGFSSGDELVRALAAATPPAEALEAAVDLRMLEQHGDISSPEALERAADKAVHNEMRARVLAAEANALAKAVGPTQQVGTDRGGRPVMRPILPAAAKAYAAAMIARMRIRDIRPGTYTAGEVRAAKAAAKAQQSGDLELAATEKRNQLIQLYAARAAHDALDESQAGVRYLRKFDSEGSRKGLTPDYLEQIDSLLERFDLRTGETLRDIDKRTALADWITSQREQGLEPDVPPALVNEAFRKSHKDMTLEELRGLVDTVKQIEHLGRLKKKLLTAKDQREFEVVRDEIAGSIALNADGRQANTRTPTTNLGQWAQQLRRFWASHIKAATWARIFDGAKDGGPAWTYFIAPANERASMETTMRAEATAKLSEILAPLFKLGRMSGSGQFFPSIGRSLNRQERIAIALNTGNEGNLQRLLGGEGWRLEQIQPVLQSLTTTEWQAVQAIWDYLETFRPAIGEKEMRVYGKEPAWVEPRGFTVVAANGQTVALRGGYYPIKYDPAASQRAEENYDAEEAKRQMQGAYTTATTKRSFTKARVEEVVGRPLLYNLSGLYSGVNDVIHDLAWHEWLIDVNRLLRSKKIDEAIRSHYGPDAKAQLKSWVADIAEGERGAANAGEAVLSRLRQGVSAAGLGFNVMSALMQPLGFTQSMVRIGPVHVARGIGQFLSGPLSSAKTVNEKSEFMRNRARTRFRELAEVRNRVQDQNQALAAVNAGAFFMMLRMQQLVDIPTWLGAYDKAIVANETEERAIALADQAVIDAQGGGQLKDLSAIERGGPALKLFTVFYSFMNTAFNLGVAEGMTQRSKGRLAANMLLLYTVPAVLGVALKDALQPGSGGDDEDWEQTARKLIAAQLEYLMGMMVVVREFQAAGKIVAGSEGVRDYQGPAGVRAVGDVIRLGQQAAQGDFDDAFRKAAVNVIGDFSGLPAAQINKTITGAQAMAEGETENPAALVFGFARQ